MKRIFALFLVLAVSGCMTPQQIAARNAQIAQEQATQAQTQNLVQQAQQQEAQHPKNRNEAIQQCIVYANRADMTSVALGVPFDAYVRRDGSIMLYGSPQASFEFQKCMNDAGYPIYPKN